MPWDHPGSPHGERSPKASFLWEVILNMYRRMDGEDQSVLRNSYDDIDELIAERSPN